MASCWLFHDWDKWEQFWRDGKRAYVGAEYPPDVRARVFEFKEPWQRRTCKRCGKMQQEQMK